VPDTSIEPLYSEKKTSHLKHKGISMQSDVGKDESQASRRRGKLRARSGREVPFRGESVVKSLEGGAAERADESPES